MSVIDIYEREKKEEYEELKIAALTLLREGKLNRDVLLNVMKKSYQIGHYVGHCQGEQYKRRNDAI